MTAQLRLYIRRQIDAHVRALLGDPRAVRVEWCSVCFETFDVDPSAASALGGRPVSRCSSCSTSGEKVGRVSRRAHAQIA